MLTRTDAAGTTRFEWDGFDMVRETAPSGGQTRYYIPQGELHSFERGGQLFLVHSDALGNVRKVTDASGSVVVTFDVDGWGNALPSSVDIVPGGLAYRFVGALGVRLDTDTGLVYMRQRWYSPVFARFISWDPSNRAAGENLYEYAYSNPVVYIDPSGLRPFLYAKDKDGHIYQVPYSPVPYNPIVRLATMSEEARTSLAAQLKLRRKAGLTAVSGPSQIRCNCGADALSQLTGTPAGEIGPAENIARFYGHPVGLTALRRGDLVVFNGHIGTVWGYKNGQVIVGGADGYYGTFYGTIKQWSEVGGPFPTKNPRYYRLDPRVARLKCPPNIPADVLRQMDR